MKIAFKIASRKNSLGKQKLNLRITDSRLFSREIQQNIFIYKEFWLKDEELVSNNHPAFEDLNALISKIKGKRDIAITKFQAKTLTPDGVVRYMSSDVSTDSLESYIHTAMKPDVSNNQYINLLNKLNGFKKMTNRTGKAIRFKDIDANFWRDANIKGSERVRNKDISPRSYKEYVGSIISIVGHYEDDHPNSEIYSCKKKLKTVRSKRKVNKVMMTEPFVIFDAIQKIKTLEQWEAIAVWMLQFCMRGFYYGDLLTMTEFGLVDEMGNSVQRSLFRERFILHDRSKSEVEMKIHIHKKPTLQLVQMLKNAFVYTFIDTRLEGKSIIPDINDSIKLLDYDHRKHSKFHKDLWRRFNKKTSPLGFRQKDARKSFTQMCTKLRLPYDTKNILQGRALGDKTLEESYENNNTPELLKEVEEAHVRILKEYKCQGIVDALTVKLKAIVMRKKLPKWIIQHSGVHSVKGKKKILTSFQYGKIEWTEIDRKFKSYFMADRSKEKGYWADEDSWLDEKNVMHVHLPNGSSINIRKMKSTLTTANENVKDIIDKQKQIKEAENSIMEITKELIK